MYTYTHLSSLKHEKVHAPKCRHLLILGLFSNLYTFSSETHQYERSPPMLNKTSSSPSYGKYSVKVSTMNKKKPKINLNTFRPN